MIRTTFNQTPSFANMPSTKQVVPFNLEGELLKKWKVGTYIGSGACASIYNAEYSSSLNKLDKDKSYIIKIAKMPSKSEKGYKQKVRVVDTIYSEYLQYQQFQQSKLTGVPHMPMYAYGEDKGYRFLVIEKLGYTLLEDLKTNGCFESTRAAWIGIELIKTIKQLHTRNILHSDIKPDNFMFDQDGKKIFCVDFGITSSYQTIKGVHKEQTYGTIAGTPTFLSLDCHNGSCRSRKDDIESLLYVLIYLMKGSLPWENAKNDKEGAKIKSNTKIKDLCDSLPDKWQSMLLHIRSCDFKAMPEYDYYISQMEEGM